MGVVYSQLSDSEFVRSASQLAQVYAAAFGPPPYNKQPEESRLFAAMLPDQVRRDGFRCIAAAESESGRLLGFAYGYRCLAELSWNVRVSRALGGEQASFWLADAFQLAELAVAPAAQGRGIGGQIHDRLLTGLSYSSAVLSTLDTETAALGLYRRRGWAVLLSRFSFHKVARPYCIMGLQCGPAGLLT